MLETLSAVQQQPTNEVGHAGYKDDNIPDKPLIGPSA
jgi:hypothetical protein